MKTEKNVLSGWMGWAKENLPNFSFGGLTDTDVKVVEASILVAELAAKVGVGEVLVPWVAVVVQAQEFTRELCCHLVARQLDWGDRDDFAWALVEELEADVVWNHRPVCGPNSQLTGRVAFRWEAIRDFRPSKVADIATPILDLGRWGTYECIVAEHAESLVGENGVDQAAVTDLVGCLFKVDENLGLVRKSAVSGYRK